MNWKNIIKAPPPRPYKPGEKKIWESTKQPTSTYIIPRVLSDATDEFKDKHGMIVDTRHPYQRREMDSETGEPNPRYKMPPKPYGLQASIVPLYTWNPYQQELQQTQALTDLEGGQTVTLRELQRDFITEAGEISIDITKLQELKDKFLKIYEQMLDDIYDHFEAWEAWIGWNWFVQEFHPEENFGSIVDNTDKNDLSTAHITLNFIEDQLHLLLEHINTAKQGTGGSRGGPRPYNNSEFVQDVVNNVEKGVNEAFNLLNSLKTS